MHSIDPSLSILERTVQNTIVAHAFTPIQTAHILEQRRATLPPSYPIIPLTLNRCVGDDGTTYEVFPNLVGRIDNIWVDMHHPILGSVIMIERSIAERYIQKLLKDPQHTR